MASSPDERLHLIAELYRFVARVLPDDIAEARSAEEAHALRANLQSLQDAFLRAQRIDLGREGARVEAAFMAAQHASTDVQASFAEGRALSQRVASMSAAVSAIQHLLDVADDDGFGGARIR